MKRDKNNDNKNSKVENIENSVENVKNTDKLKKFDIFRIAALISSLVCFFALWILSKNLTFVASEFLMLTTVLFALFLLITILEIYNLKKTKKAWIFYLLLICLLAFIFSLILFRLDVMVVMMQTKNAEITFLEAQKLFSTMPKEQIEVIKNAYLHDRIELVAAADKTFAINTLISLGSCGLIASLCYIVYRFQRKKAPITPPEKID
ncbi:MAG: hypothetical protein RR054_01325 [Clostridia bacterium]